MSMRCGHIDQAVPVGDGWTLAIDFGTTATVAAARDASGARMIDIDGVRSMPSTVAWVGGRLVVGAEAERHRVFDPGAAAVHPKRVLGRRGTLLLGTNAVPTIDAAGAVLEAAAEAAIGAHHGRRPSSVVLTHPVRWSDAQVDALVEAARVAHLDEPITVAEPIAAALHFGIERIEPGQHLAVYDLGGGTFDTVVLTRVGDQFEVAGPPGGNERIGGDDFDSRLMDLLLTRIETRSGDWATHVRTSDEKEWRRASAELLLESRRAKETLSRQTTCAVALPSPMSGEVRVTRPELEALLHDDVATTVDELVDTVERAGLSVADLTTTYMTGGASRMPIVTRLLHDGLGLAPDTLDDPKTVVALGATTLSRPQTEPAAPPPDTTTTDHRDRPPPPAAPDAPSRSEDSQDDAVRKALPWIATAATLLVVIGLVAFFAGRSDDGAREATVSVGGAPTGMAYGGGAAWASVDDAGTVAEIDPGSNGVRSTVDVGGGPLGVAYANGSIWVVDEEADAVVRVDRDDRTVVATIPVGRRPLAIATGEGALWVANYDSDSVSRIDPSTNAVTATIAVGRGPSAVAVGEGAVWAANGDDDTVSRIDPGTNTQTLTLPVGAQPLAIAAGGGAVWVASFSDAAVARIDPDRDEVSGSVPVGKGPAALVLDGADLWVANSQDDSVMRIDTGELRVVGTKGAGRGPAALTVGAGSLWVANGLDGTVSRLPLG
jgi:YVTN family beta-propeller protein